MKDSNQSNNCIEEKTSNNVEEIQASYKIELERHSTDEFIQCSICEDTHEKSIMHKVEVKGKKKYICKGCADIVHGLI